MGLKYIRRYGMAGEHFERQRSAELRGRLRHHDMDNRSLSVQDSEQSDSLISRNATGHPENDVLPDQGRSSEVGDLRKLLLALIARRLRRAVAIAARLFLVFFVSVAVHTAFGLHSPS